ncbi:MAG: hypothetical protein IIA44_16475, partial [Acidobacteria bacterium]|nr:hypothetical protein [Acidobacteriota bacterium]
CGGSISSSVTGGPVGDDIQSGDRGLPHCTGGDDLWQSFGPLQAGVYYVPIFTAPGGHFGEYQFHVTVGACPIAACCLPGSYCVDPGTQFLITDPTTGNPVPCDPDVCAVGTCESCALAIETECSAIEGFWNGLGNLPSGGATFITDCGFGGGGPCELGSCCLAEGVCQDAFDPEGECDPQSPSTCMTRGLCETEGGVFVGGAQCDFPQPPCPACLIQGAENCQLPAKTPEFTAATGSVSDLTTPPNGTVSADDFIPQGDTITSVCAWGFYHDAKLPAGLLDCSGVVTDEFRVRVFGDAGGIPDTGNLIGESLVTGTNITRGKEPDTAFVNGFSGATNAVPQGYTLILDTPITGLSVGVKHWLEIANNTTGPTDAAKTCWWNWLHSFPSADDEDGFSVTGGNSGGVEDPAEYLPGASRYIYGSGRPYDLAFCVGTGPAGDQPLVLDPVTTLKGCCWSCPADGDPVPEVLSLTECGDGAGYGGVWNPQDPDCSGTFLDLGDLLPDSCTGVALSSIASVGQILPCGDGVLDLGEQCDPGPDVKGDNCDANCQLICPAPDTAPKFCQGGTNNEEPCTDITECKDQSAGTSCAPLGGALLITAGLHATDTNCAGTDGPTNIPSESGFIGVGHDAWFFYFTDCTGRMHVNACPSGSGFTKSGPNVADNTVAI